MLAVDGQLAGTPSVIFDAVAVLLSDEGAAIDLVRNAFGHLKAIAVDKGGKALLKIANVGQDGGIVDASDKNTTMGSGKIRSDIGVTLLRANQV